VNYFVKIKTITELPDTIRNQTDQYKFSKPMNVRISSKDNLFFAENETLVVVGTGSSPTEAIDDLCKHIIHFYQ